MAGGRDAVDRRWIVLLGLFVLTSLVEPIGMGQIIALLPLYLRRIGVDAVEVPQWVGLFNPLIFLFGLPLVPLWGVWADKYSRKVVIVRSSLVEAIVLAGVAASTVPWQLAASLLLIGLSLGNTGVMLSALRDEVPRERLGTAIALVGAAGPVGFALGPALAGLMVDGLGRPLSDVFVVSSALMLAVTLLLTFGMTESRPAVIPSGATLTLAYGAIRSVFTDRSTRALFALFGLMLLAGQMTGSYLPLLVERVNGGQLGLVSAIGLVVGGAALVGALVSPVAGALSDRIGFRPVLIGSLLGGSGALGLMTVAASVPLLAFIATVYALCLSAGRAMIFGLLSVEVPAAQRSATLNLVFLPLYLAGIAGPALGALVVGRGVPLVYAVAAALLAFGGVLVLRIRPAHR